ncbi:MAG: biotin transporter BioY [Verrucomicrobia bacterium]|nr:biotin transporter BioY [Verrucomicrobiota bacterium]MBS0636835.1 biotin transporter BioY [Verrucomicrobiota bacterium]
MYSKAENIAVLKNEAVQILIGVGLLACCSQISIPLQPIPITMQSVAVLLIGLFYSQKTAIKTVLAYLAVGAMGAPVFSCMGAGVIHFLKPSAGFLFGFLAAVALMTYVRDRIQKETFLTQLLCCTLGTVALFAVGVSWLACQIGIEKAIMVGFVPFIVPGIVKGLIVAAACKHIKATRWA